MIEELYSASEVQPMYFDTEVERDGAFLIMNSSLFYCYWITYGDFHHLNWSHIEPFPFPTLEDLRTYSDQIHKYTEELWRGMEECFDPESGLTGEFHMQPLKPLIDEIDDLLADIYGLSEEELNYVKNYLADHDDGYGRAGPANMQISER